MKTIVHMKIVKIKQLCIRKSHNTKIKAPEHGNNAIKHNGAHEDHAMQLKI
jgi:hypothetical protein